MTPAPESQHVALITWQQTLDVASFTIRQTDAEFDKSPTSDFALLMQMHQSVYLNYSGADLEGFLRQAAVADLSAAIDAVRSVLHAARDEYGVPVDDLLRVARERGPVAAPLED